MLKQKEKESKHAQQRKKVKMEKGNIEHGGGGNEAQ